MTSALRKTLAGAAALLGVLAAFAGSPYLARRVKFDAVSATCLAEWIRDGKPHLRIVDLRPASEFADGHVPGAENLIPSTEKGATLVVISDEGAMFPTIANGSPSLYLLSGGEEAWLNEVMNPVLAADATPHAVSAFHQTAALSRYFGGSPRIADTKDGRAPRRLSSSVAAALSRRRGC